MSDDRSQPSTSPAPGEVEQQEPPRKPLIAITMGDPAGVGPEVVVKALADTELRSQARFIIYGLQELLCYAADQAEVSPYWFHCPHEDVDRVESGVVVADFYEYSMLGPGLRHPTAEGGHASLRFVDEAISAAAGGLADAIVTGPIHKISWKMAGCKAPGHTEYLAHAFDARRYTMMFVGGPLRVALASTHVGLFELRNSFTIGRVFQPIDQLDEALRRWFGIARPKIAVAGLNPHAGEEGRFGDEEGRIIEPAILMARDLGIDVEGPFPADTLFWKASRGRYDGLVAMYHDQGLIPVKLLAFDSSVNVTLGLPVIRTSVDHGTAFDIAGTNRASAGSMKAALKLAIEMARRNGLETWPQREPLPAADPSRTNR
ncbi:MAG TPA: 4-hydroxythreonine-4-phosphate dehydrogenase PdxA [Phycisphaerae bacterium]|nr:4-hydroxythreonine-4-phosphate dehydrogenase PdxA [Phycisphaerae bacterium]